MRVLYLKKYINLCFEANVDIQMNLYPYVKVVVSLLPHSFICEIFFFFKLIYLEKLSQYMFGHWIENDIDRKLLNRTKLSSTDWIRKRIYRWKRVKKFSQENFDNLFDDFDISVVQESIYVL